MIITQHDRYLPPLNVKLAVVYRAVKWLADTMDVRSWTHHHRANNKMAGKAAG